MLWHRLIPRLSSDRAQPLGKLKRDFRLASLSVLEIQRARPDLGERVGHITWLQLLLTAKAHAQVALVHPHKRRGRAPRRHALRAAVLLLRADVVGGRVDEALYQ